METTRKKHGKATSDQMASTYVRIKRKAGVHCGSVACEIYVLSCSNWDVPGRYHMDQRYDLANVFFPLPTDVQGGCRLLSLVGLVGGATAADAQHADRPHVRPHGVCGFRSAGP